MRSVSRCYWLASVAIFTLLQLASIYVLWNHPTLAAIPPLRLSVVVISQFVVGLIVGLKLHAKRRQILSYFLLFFVSYVVALFFLYGLGPPVAGMNLPPWEPGMEAGISGVLLIGFAVINVTYLFRLARATQI